MRASPTPAARMPPRDILLALLVCLAWAGNFLGSATALREMPPLLFTALRLVLLVLLLAPFLRRPGPGQWPRLLAITLSTGVMHFGLSFWALALAGDLSSPAIVMQSYVPMSVLLAWAILGERFAWRTGTAIALSFGGVLVLGLDPLVLDNPLSLLLMLASAFFLAISTVLMRDLGGVTRFSLRQLSSKGAENISREGAHCNERSLRSYGFADTEGKRWIESTKAKWQKASFGDPFRQTMLKNLCPDGLAPRSAEALLANLNKPDARPRKK